MEDLIAQRYVKALLDVASDNKKDEYVKTLNLLSEVYGSSDIGTILESPMVSNADKLSLVLEALGKNIDGNMENFIKVLADNKRLSLIPMITTMINMQIQKQSNEYKGIVVAKETLSDASLASLEASLVKYTGSKVELTQQSSDIDGIKVSVEDLGIEVNFSKDRVKQELIDFIKKSL